MKKILYKKDDLIIFELNGKISLGRAVYTSYQGLYTAIYIELVFICRNCYKTEGLKHNPIRVNDHDSLYTNRYIVINTENTEKL